MEYFLTSSPCEEDSYALTNRNGLREAFVGALPHAVRALFVASDPDNHAQTDEYAEIMRKSLTEAGIALTSYDVLDGRTVLEAPELVANAQLILLAGGHVPTQNAFFEKFGLRELMADFDGVVLGTSAGTMNAADEVYVQPELEGESTDPGFERFAEGLAITQTKVLPHFDKVRDSMLDGKRLFEDITYPDSMGRVFVALPDGSYLHGGTGRDEEICGEAYAITNGWLRKVCSNGKRVSAHGATKYSLESNPGKPDGKGGRAMLARMNTGAHEQLANWGLDFLRIPEGAHMLDVGCGGGANLLRLLERCPTGRVWGVDHSHTSVEASSAHCADEIAKGVCRVEEGDVLDLRFDDASFDVVSAFETVYFWPSIEKAFAEVLRTLVPGGSFLVCNDDDGTTESSREFARTLEGMSVYTADEVAELMEAAGFVGVETHHLRDESMIAIIGHKA